MHNDGELGTARAAAKVGVPLIVSSVASRSMEEIADAQGPNGHRWYQLYWQVHPPRHFFFFVYRYLPEVDPDPGYRTHSVELTQSLLRRAKASGFTALVITVDTMLVGWRPHDHGVPYSPTGHGFGIQPGTSDPTFMSRFGLEARHERPPFPYLQEDLRRRAANGDPTAQQAMFLGSKWVGEIASGIFRSWDEIQFIRDNWDGQIVLKGILAPEVRSRLWMTVSIYIIDPPCRMLRKQSTWASTRSSSPTTVSAVLDGYFRDSEMLVRRPSSRWIHRCARRARYGDAVVQGSQSAKHGHVHYPLRLGHSDRKRHSQGTRTWCPGCTEYVSFAHPLFFGPGGFSLTALIAPIALSQSVGRSCMASPSPGRRA